MPELKRCPFCGGTNVKVKEDPLIVCGHRCWFVVHMSKDCPLCGAFDWWHSSAKYTTKEKAIEAWNQRATPEPLRANARPAPNLDGKCGSCEYSVTAEGFFGNSQSQVECKKPELQASRRRQDHPLTAVRSRTTKGCKHYKRRNDHA